MVVMRCFLVLGCMLFVLQRASAVDHDVFDQSAYLWTSGDPLPYIGRQQKRIEPIPEPVLVQLGYATFHAQEPCSMYEKGSAQVWHRWFHESGMDPYQTLLFLKPFPDGKMLDSMAEKIALQALMAKPIPTTAMQEWAKKVPKTWLMPVPKGVIDTSNGDSWGVISPVVKEGVWRLDVGRQGIYNKRPADDFIARSDADLSLDDALAWSVYHGAIMPVFHGDQVVMRKKRHVRADKHVHEYYYVSGRSLIGLSVATDIENVYLDWYTQRYPPTITKDNPLDFAAIAIKRLDTMIPLMEQSIGDPVPYLRSSARAYPFDEALFKACQTLPPQTPITSYATYNKEREEIHRIWADAQVAETVDLKSYQDRVRAHRESWIGNMRAARTRIAASGLAPTKPTFRLWYTDSPPPRYGDEDVDW